MMRRALAVFLLTAGWCGAQPARATVATSTKERMSRTVARRLAPAAVTAQDPAMSMRTTLAALLAIALVPATPRLAEA